MSTEDGIYVHAEFHAWKFVSGRGRLAPNVVTKFRRSEIFKETLRIITQLPGAQLFNACFSAGQEALAFERLLNRINRTMDAWDSHAIIICDEGEESTYTRLTRRMGVYNPIPSAFGVWQDTGELTRNIPTDRILEDPFFKRSERSYFIQLVDFVAYALLRREAPIPSKTKYGLDQAFNLLRPILFLAATRRDPEGILRP